MQSPQFFPQRWRRRAKKIPFSIIYWHCSLALSLSLVWYSWCNLWKMHRPKEVTGGKISTRKTGKRRWLRSQSTLLTSLFAFTWFSFFRHIEWNIVSFRSLALKELFPKELVWHPEGGSVFSESFISSSWLWCSTLILSSVWHDQGRTEKLEQQPFWVAHQKEAEVVCSNTTEKWTRIVGKGSVRK